MSQTIHSSRTIGNVAFSGPRPKYQSALIYARWPLQAP
jgi:hypothetical protein